MTDVLLIRHGETDWNRQLRFQGQLDVPLNAVGQDQARRLAERLAQENFSHLISSDLQRARQTAEPVGRHPRLPQALEPELQRALREQHFGLAEGMRVAEIQRDYPQAWAQWVRFEPDFAFSGGESTRQFHARVMGALHALAQGHPGQTIVLVTHGGVLDMIYRSALALPLSGPRQSLIPNAGVSRVRLAGQAIQILQWADTAHLADMPPQPVYDQQKLAARSQDAAA
ncbi:MAG: histidine phosphatase family protein [Hylemonella sp.]